MVLQASIMDCVAFDPFSFQQDCLNRREAAEHCGRSLKRFEVECTVVPIRFPNGDLRYDVRDLDKWLDFLKDNGDDSESIIKKLVTP